MSYFYNLIDGIWYKNLASKVRTDNVTIVTKRDKCHTSLKVAVKKVWHGPFKKVWHMSQHLKEMKKMKDLRGPALTPNPERNERNNWNERNEWFEEPRSIPERWKKWKKWKIWEAPHRSWTLKEMKEMKDLRGPAASMIPERIERIERNEEPCSFPEPWKKWKKQ
jgi:hypothetical protein